jgi:hypothetical protein
VIDAAEANLIAAVRLHLTGANIVPVLVLANSAREIVATLGEKIGLDTAHKEISTKLGKSVPEIIAPISKAAGFLKHADREPTAEIELKESEVEIALYLACLDLAVVTGGLPIEGQVYEGWFLAKGVKRVSELPMKMQTTLRNLIKYFPGIRSADAATQKKLGLEALKRAETDTSLTMTITRDVKQIIAARNTNEV